MEVFAGFTDIDFEAYSQEKWASNAFNRQRQAVKEKLRQLGQDIIQRLGPTASPLTLGASPEYPSQWNGKKVRDQWLFLLLGSSEELRHAERIADQERPLSLLLADPLPEHKHLCLAVSLEKDGLYAGLVLWPHASVDARNLAARLSSPEGQSEFLSLAQVSGSLEWRAGGSALPGPEALLAGLKEKFPPFEVRKAFSREEAMRLGADLSGAIAEIFRALLPLYQFSAWSLTNDRVGLAEQLRQEAAAREAERRKEEEERQRREQEREREREAARQQALKAEQESAARQQALAREREARRALREKESPATRAEDTGRSAKGGPRRRGAPSLERREPQRRASGPQRPRTESAPEAQQPKGSHRTSGPSEERPPKRQRREPAVAPTPAEPGSLRTGDRVRLLEGLFAGKVGVVQEVDHRREVKIALGNMSVKAAESTLSKL